MVTASVAGLKRGDSENGMLPCVIGIPETMLPTFNLSWSRPEALHLKLGKLNARVANVPNRLRTFLAVGRPIKDINEYFDLKAGTRIGNKNKSEPFKDLTSREIR